MKILKLGKRRPRYFTLIIGILIIFLGAQILLNNETTDTDKSKFSNIHDPKNSSTWNLSPIHIDDSGSGDYTWAEALLEPWCTGSGTFMYPYIIQNVTIDGLNSSSCITITNSDVYFTIKNCTLIHSGSEAGIKLYNANKSTITENLIHSHQESGIRIQKCDNISMINNTIKDCWIGTFVNNMDDDVTTLSLKLNKFINCELIIIGGLSKQESPSSYDIDTTNLVNNKPLYFYKNQVGLINDDFTNAGEIILYNCNNSVISSNNLLGSIQLINSNNNALQSNTLAISVIGIVLFHSHYNILQNNSLINHQTALAIYLSLNNSISRNIVKESLCGMDMTSSDNNSITENVFKSNMYGIILREGFNNTISKNEILNNSEGGIRFDYASQNKITSNLLEGNGKYGISITNPISNSNYNIICENTIRHTLELGLKIDEQCLNNTIFNNYFLENKLHAQDNGMYNKWDRKGTGNYWDDYTGLDLNDDNIGDTPYDISGTAGSKDNFPIFSILPPSIQINAPLTNSLFGSSAPNYDVTITGSALNTSWYSLDGGITNITFTQSIGFINQGEWDKITNGTVVITFYANNSLGYIGKAEIVLRKDIIAPFITIIDPSPEVEFQDAPGFEITIDESKLDEIWYTIDDGAHNYTITDFTGAINQTAWDSAPSGSVTIRFYARDLAGNIGMNSVIVIKTSKSPPEIPGYDLYLVLGVIGVLSTLIIRKRFKS